MFFILLLPKELLLLALWPFLRPEHGKRLPRWAVRFSWVRAHEQYQRDWLPMRRWMEAPIEVDLVHAYRVIAAHALAAWMVLFTLILAAWAVLRLPRPVPAWWSWTYCLGAMVFPSMIALWLAAWAPWWLYQQGYRVIEVELAMKIVRLFRRGEDDSGDCPQRPGE